MSSQPAPEPSTAFHVMSLTPSSRVDGLIGGRPKRTGLTTPAVWQLNGKEVPAREPMPEDTQAGANTEATRKDQNEDVGSRSASEVVRDAQDMPHTHTRITKRASSSVPTKKVLNEILADLHADVLPIIGSAGFETH